MFTVCMKINPEQRKELCEHLAMNGYVCHDNWIADNCIEVDDEEIYEIHTILSDRDIEYFVKRYYVCGIGYDENNCVTDYEKYFDDFDTYEEAYELFVKLQCRSEESFFTAVPEVYQLLIQLEECEETKDEINCIDVRNEWWIVNPNYEVLIYDRSNLESLRKVFDVCTPQECANMFGKPVKDEDKIYYPEEV